MKKTIRKLSAAVAMSLVVGVSLAACGGSSSSTAASETKTGSADGFGGAVTATLTVDAHGTKCFTEAVAVVKDDVILAAYLDDFQFTSADAGVTAVPNSDADFAAGYAEGKVLVVAAK